MVAEGNSDFVLATGDLPFLLQHLARQGEPQRGQNT